MYKIKYMQDFMCDFDYYLTSVHAVLLRVLAVVRQLLEWLHIMVMMIKKHLLPLMKLMIQM